MAGIDVNALVADIKSAANGVLTRDVSTLRGFAEEQVKAIGHLEKPLAYDALP